MRYARLATALLAATAIGLGAVEIQANLTARAELDQHHGLAVASIFAEPLTGRLTLRGVRTGNGETQMTIGILDLPLSRQNLGLVGTAAASPFDDKPEEAKPDDTKPDEPAPTAQTPAGPGTASADDVTITSGTTTYRIKHIEMAGTSLSDADLAALVDPKSTEPLEGRLKKLTATSVNVPEILADDMSDGAERHATMTQVVLAGANAGKVASGGAGSVTFRIKAGDDDVSGTTGPIQVSGVDLAQIAHIFGTVRSDDAEPILPLYDSVSVTAMKVVNAKEKSTLTLAALKETGAKARALKTDILSASKAGKEKLSDAQQKAVLEDMSHSFEIGAIEATDLAVQGGDTGSLTLASVSMHDFAKDKIGGFSLRAFRFEGPQAKMSVGAVEIGAFQLSPPERGPEGASAGMRMPFVAKIDVNQVDFDGSTNSAEKDSKPNHVAFKLAHLGFGAAGEPGDIPKSMTVTVDNATFTLPSNAGQAQPIYDMGYRDLDVTMGLATTYDAAGQSLMIKDLKLTGASMGSLAIGLHLVNVTKGLVSPNQEVVKASALAILAKGVTLDIVNDGLVDKALDWKAKQDGTDVGKERDGLIDFFANKLPASLNNSANVKIVGSAVAKFIAEPKTLHIGIESKSGLGVGSMALLADPELLIDSLDVKASANQ